jgi:hypothetical protein
LTQAQVNFCVLVHDYALKEFGYSFAGLRLNSSGQSWTIRLKPLDAPESQVKQFTVFPEQVQESVETRQLPKGLLCSFADEFMQVHA